MSCDTVSGEAWTNVYSDNETMTDKIKHIIEVQCCDLKFTGITYRSKHEAFLIGGETPKRYMCH